MFTSDTMSILEMSILIPTSTGGPAQTQHLTVHHPSKWWQPSLRKWTCGCTIQLLYLRSQAWDECRSLWVVYPRWLWRMTCCWARLRWGESQQWAFKETDLMRAGGSHADKHISSVSYLFAGGLRPSVKTANMWRHKIPARQWVQALSIPLIIERDKRQQKR